MRHTLTAALAVLTLAACSDDHELALEHPEPPPAPCVPCTAPPGHCMHDPEWHDWYAGLDDTGQADWVARHWNDCEGEELVRPPRYVDWVSPPSDPSL